MLPDNGLLTLVEQRDGIEAVREITNPEWMIGSKLSSTFHGRDIFSPVGAHLARGDDWTKVGPEMAVKDLVRLDLKVAKVDDRGLSATVIATDGPFGNLVTNVDAEDFLKLGYQRGQEVAGDGGRQRDEDQVREDVQRCAAGTAAALHRLARTSGAGGESEEFCRDVWDQAAGGAVDSAGEVKQSCVLQRSEDDREATPCGVEDLPESRKAPLQHI